MDVHKDSHLQRTELHGRIQEPDKVFDYGSHVQECWINHERVSEFSLVSQENKILGALQFDIDVPCLVQWGAALVFCAHLSTQRFAERWRHPRCVEQGD